VPRALLVLALVVCGVAGLGSGCGERDETPVQKATVERSTLTFEGVYYGELQAAEKVDVHVPDIPDTWQVTVDSVLADGTKVNAGDVILTFVRETLEMDLRDELEKLEVAQAERRKVLQQLDKERIDLELEVKRKELARDRAKLAVVEGVNLISKLELDKAKLDVEKAELELDLANKALTAFQEKRRTALKIEDLKVQAAQRAVDNKREGLEKIEVRAPVDGVIYAPYTRLNWQRTKVAPGVVGRPGDLVLTLPDLSKYVAHLYVRQRDAALVQVGDEAEITPLILPDESITGRVVKKEDFATTRNERLGTETAAGNLKEYMVTVELDEAPAELRPGNSAKIAIATELATEVPVLPAIFVQQRDDKTWFATRPDGSTVDVELGRTNLTHVEIVGGLDVGDDVILPVE
jgi:multidrug resistance efflux pump